MKVFHDDLRDAPDGWVLARTNHEAKKHLRTGKVEEISLDHDLGGVSTGYHLVRWMVRHNCVPARVTIHSFNPVGAARMARELADAGHQVTRTPMRPY